MFASKDLFFTRTSGDYQISRSVRLRSSASAYFNRTPAVVGDRKTWTWSAWVKIGNPSAASAYLFTEYTDASNYFLFGFNAGTLFVQMRVGGANAFVHDTDAVYRDPSAWYHIVYVLDTTQATDSNRAKLYVNGVQVSLTQYLTNTQWPALNTNYNVNTANPHRLGYDQPNAVYFDGYLTEVNFIDGQALTPSSFGQVNAYGVWSPVKYTGTYGTNGFYLNFSDNSNNTATTIGKDYSGNGNNWTPNNISVTTGATYDSMIDVPTLYADGSTGRGNYAVMNPVKVYAANFAFSQANLQVSDASTSTVTASSSLRTPTSGKWYWEITATTISGILGFICAANESTADSNTGGSSGYYRSNGTIGNLTNVAQTSGNSYTSGDVIGVAVDVDNGTVQFYKNNVAQGATPSFTFTAGTIIVPLLTTDNSAGTKTFQANFGQRPFRYTPPTGFSALNTQNLPTPTISNGAAYMAASLYTGNGSTQSITNTVNGVSFKPDLIWIKSRSNALSHKLVNSVVGIQKALSSDSTAAESSDTGGVTAFNSNGFTIGTTLAYNTNAATFVAWQWLAGAGSTSSNTSGSITSTVSVNATAGFSIATYTGTGANATVGHGLGVAPSMIIVKSRSAAATNWVTYTASQGATKYLLLNTTAAVVTDSTPWNNTSPTSSVFSVGTSSNTNGNTSTFVAYCFAAVAGYSAFGSYTGNGSADGPFVYLGFRPRFVMVKRTDSTGGWNITDTSIAPYNLSQALLQANTSAAEVSTAELDILSNGFKYRGTSTNVLFDHNVSGATYIYAAFAENPFKYSLAR